MVLLEPLADECWKASVHASVRAPGVSDRALNSAQVEDMLVAS